MARRLYAILTGSWERYAKRRMAQTRRLAMMSRRSIDIMLDLIENRVACMQVIDREDHRQLAIMTQARRELLALRAGATVGPKFGPAPGSSAGARRMDGPTRGTEDMDNARGAAA
jgi:hypothetical protein